MVWEFIKELAKGVFSSYSSITTLLSFVVFIFWLLLPKLKVEGRMKVTKKTLEAIPWSYRLLTVLGFLFVSVILTSYSMYENEQQTIGDLQAKLDAEHKKDDSSLKPRVIVGGSVGFVESGAVVKDNNSVMTVHITTDNP